MPTPVVSWSERSTGGRVKENHRGRERELQHHEAERDVRRANDHRRFAIAALAEHHRDAGEVQQQNHGERAMNHLHPNRGGRDVRIRATRRDGRARERRAGILGREAAQRDGENRENAAPKADRACDWSRADRSASHRERAAAESPSWRRERAASLRRASARRLAQCVLPSLTVTPPRMAAREDSAHRSERRAKRAAVAADSGSLRRENARRHEENGHS